MARPKRIVAAVGLVALVTVSCTYSGGELDNPIARSLTWFSYAGGDDLRAACGPGARDRIRFIYNGVWDGYVTNAPTQVRTYDIAAVMDGDGAVMVTRVFGENNVAQITLDDPFAAWRGARAEVMLGPQEYRTLRRALEESGFFQAAPYGLRLPSNRFYWLAVGCIDGSFRLNGWLHPSERFARVTFDRALFALDKTGIPPTPPGDVERFPPMRDHEDTGPVREPSFILQPGPNGLL